MRPYVGNNFHDARTPSILLIGESHYLPKGSSQHLNADTWYEGNRDTLSADEVDYISTASLINEGCKEGFSNKAFAIWRSSFREINEYGPRYSDYTRVADDIAFYNFFLRPSLEGESLKVALQDHEIANDAFRLHYRVLKPTAIILLSSLAREHLDPPEPPVPVVAAPHPASQWWNRVSHRYGNKKGREVLADFIKTINWPQSADSK